MKRFGIFILAVFGVVYGVSALRVAHSQSYSNQPWAQYVSTDMNDGMTRYTLNVPTMKMVSESFTPNDPVTSRDQFLRCEAALTRNFRMLIQKGFHIFQVIPCSEYTQPESQFDGDIKEKSRFHSEILFFSKN